MATKADMDDYNNERNLAMHESAHAVGHWIMGHELGYMQFNDDRTDIDNNHAANWRRLRLAAARLPEVM